MLEDEVRLVKGFAPDVDEEVWDKIYVATLFTFGFDVDVGTINHYKLLVNNINDLYVGGIMASLMPDRIVAATGIDRSHILTGLFTDTSVVGDDNDINVDELPFDHDILEQIEYKYPAGDNYFAYTTRGCPNHCSFCAVPILEPHFHVTNNIIDQIKVIDKKYGPRQHLLFLDNNVLNTADLKGLVDDFCTAGFRRGAKYIDPEAYNIVMMRHKNGDRADFLDKKISAYLERFKKSIKSAEMLETFEENGTTEKWKALYRQLSTGQRERLMQLVSLNVSELKKTPWTSDLAEILEYYLIKYSGKTEQNQKKYVQMSLIDDSDVFVED